ncbi:tRNA adenosine(34) deaminase TadA [Acidithiobacillus sp. IBUN Pt1247-S3]|uniref:tRNA adenosine(34) deaminase TadA n=1 Tax=Acidithiobacillus sp. IBUN Pt1247-S3 TaxID=3166642 RepID=UPI0034E415FB
MQSTDQVWMQAALAAARAAATLGEVPVGAVLIDAAGELLASAHNAPIANSDPTAHAEIQVLRLAAQLLGNYRLGGCTLYVTLEPCVMCFGAIVHARLARVVYAASDPKGGVIESHLQLPNLAPSNHRLEWEGGVLADEASSLLKEFFRARRATL